MRGDFRDAVFGLQVRFGTFPQTYDSGCRMLVQTSLINPVILPERERRSRDADSASGSDAATPTGSVLFIGGAPMKGRAGALPLAYLEQCAPKYKPRGLCVGL